MLLALAFLFEFEAVIFQAEAQVGAIMKARKRRRIKEEPVVEVVRELDESDSISVIGHGKSLMHLVRTLGLQFRSRKYKDMDATEKYYAKLSLNSIVDVQDEKYMALLNLNDEAKEDLKKTFQIPQLVISHPHQKLIETYEKAQTMTCKQRCKFFTIGSFNFIGDHQKKLLIIANIYKVLGCKNNFLEKWKSSSEWTLIIKLWSNIFETLFEDTVIDLVWGGDTKNDAFKIDLRLSLNFKGKMYDVSSVEFKKNGNDQKLVKADGAKVLIEGKIILNKLIEEYNLDFEKAAKKKAVVVQICGLKAVFSELRLVAPGCYMPVKFGKTLKYPHNEQRAKAFSEVGLQQLFHYKDLLVNEAKRLKNNLQKDDSNFGSQSTIESQDFLKQPYIIPDKAIKWPTANDDFFKL